ncbi:hypothetical protein GCM10020229_03280 [Kitasatospora albolonga]
MTWTELGRSRAPSAKAGAAVAEPESEVQLGSSRSMCWPSRWLYIRSTIRIPGLRPSAAIAAWMLPWSVPSTRAIPLASATPQARRVSAEMAAYSCTAASPGIWLIRGPWSFVRSGTSATTGTS